jgi:hypothetical protein
MCLGNLSPSSARTSSSLFADMAVGGGKAVQVGDGLNVPNDDIAHGHINRLVGQRASTLCGTIDQSSLAI